jgi:drug/metabolite transporter (DMT)-like permease
MKILGVLCGIVGVGLLVFGDQLEGPDPYVMRISAGVFIVLGFVFFYRRWPEKHVM